MFRTAILGFPLKAIRWLRDDIYKNSPEKRGEAEAAIRTFYDDNKVSMERRGVTEVIVKGPKHNDPRNPDPRGPHWTVDMIKEDGEFVTKRHVYPPGEDK
ncbi:hypothetical protein BO78DRAFT_431701 [Aspergillus sclerotiicarbonarius CBS 121057]|uniref:Uncharacterized protein n=1 Tax=Aspergillus sclerotiicarbonarius (strain CBS 121057 / IBT 28362) TaxID=1448318 RepID=A0A319E1Q8_ASPSB|nr:hypothetical protein BO78DRAFT_431701 [Aspergillus sclerotiicarbonarius CBS 121057]